MVALGIDQGGTKTAAVVCDFNGKILGAGLSEGACHQINGMHDAMSRVMEAANQALAASGASFSDIAAGGGGLTGVDWDYESDLVREALVRYTGVKVFTVKNDVFGAFRAGSSSGSGVCVCSGTGTNVCAVSPDGREYSFNFYCQVGHPGKLGLDAVFQSHCGLIGKTALTEAALNAFSANSVDGLFQKRLSGEVSNDRIKHFAPTVFKAASAGDCEAKNVVSRFAYECARYAAAGIKRFNMQDLPIEIVLSGGIFKTDCALLTEAFAECVRQDAPYARVVSAVYEPVVGCMLYALETAGVHLDASVSENISKTAVTWGLKRAKHVF